MHPTQENAMRFNLESARDRARYEADLLRLILQELISLWEQGIIAPRPKKAVIVKKKFETARKLAGIVTGKSRSKETNYLLSMPGIKESIRKGLKTPVKECTKKLKW